MKSNKALLNVVPANDFLTSLKNVNWQLSKMKVKSDQADTVEVGFYTKISTGKVKRVKMKIGGKVLEELGWENADKIVVFHDPNNIFNHKFVKTEKGRGLKLIVHGKRKDGSVTFQWEHALIPLEPMNLTSIKFLVWEGQLLVNLIPEKLDVSKLI